MFILCKSKKEMKKGHFWCFCYTTYEIQKKKNDGTNKYDGNTGKGILAIDPFAIKNRAYGLHKGMGAVMDITPHALNRYTQRYLKPKGLENIDFIKKIENIVLRWKHFDVVGDESSEKHNDKGLAPYDVFMSGGGILRGYIVSEMLVRFFSYVSDDMMYDDQKKWQQEMNSVQQNLGLYKLYTLIVRYYILIFRNNCQSFHYGVFWLLQQYSCQNHTYS
jgi:hypothetical protein